jgi:hypothetical protein
MRMVAQRPFAGARLAETATNVKEIGGLPKGQRLLRNKQAELVYFTLRAGASMQQVAVDT